MLVVPRPKHTSVTEWLAEQIPALRLATIERLVARGQAFLVVDGLDEVRWRKTNDDAPPPRDPRRTLLDALPRSGGVLMTCRDDERDHEKIVLVLASGATSAASFEAVLAAMGGAAGPASGEPGATDLLRELSKIASAAKQADVTIRAIDPKDPASADVLRSLR